MKFSTTILSLLITLATVYATPKNQPTLAVIPFQISPVIQTTNIGNLSISRTLVEREFSNQLMNFLTKSRKFNILTRTAIKKVMDENQLTESDWTKPDQAQKMGKLLVADYIVTGVINRLEFQIIKQRIALTGETKPRIVATLKCQFQVIQSSTGKVMFADQVIQKLKSIDVRKEIPANIRKDWTLADYKDLLFTKTAYTIGNAILEGIFPVKVVSVADKTIFLNRGKGAGIKPGQIYTVVRPGEEIIDIDTGENLGDTEKNIATIEITDIEVKFSKAKILKNTDTPRIGDICRLQKTKNKENKPDYPKVKSNW